MERDLLPEGEVFDGLRDQFFGILIDAVVVCGADDDKGHAVGPVPAENEHVGRSLARGIRVARPQGV